MLYIHIPQIFPTGFFRGIQAYNYIDLKKDSIEGECYEMVSLNRHLFDHKQMPVHGAISSIKYKISG